MKINKLAFLLLLLFSAFVANAQQFSQVPYGLTESNLTEQIRGLKAKDPQITPEILAERANEFFKINGIAFSVYLSLADCTKLRDLAKDPKANLTLSGNFQSVGGEKVKLVLPPVGIVSEECGGCSVQLTVFEMTANSFITQLKGIKVQIVFPANFSTDMVELASKDGSKSERVWRVPFRSVPLGISFDQTVIYLGFSDPVLSDLSIAVFDTGAFEICTRKEAEDGGPGKLEIVKPITAEKYILFDRWDVRSRLVFKPKC